MKLKSPKIRNPRNPDQ